jgi:hypothetical protein
MASGPTRDLPHPADAPPAWRRTSWKLVALYTSLVAFDGICLFGLIKLARALL